MPEMDHNRPTEAPLTAEEKAVIRASVREWRILGAAIGLMFSILAFLKLSSADWQRVTIAEVTIALVGGVIVGSLAGSLFGFVAGSLKARPSKQVQAPSRHPLDPDPE